MTDTKYQCPKCGGEIEDCSAGDEWGWFETNLFAVPGITRDDSRMSVGIAV
ncbi:hypothetical protein [Rodentibacter caecimuris]|uniref:hypothetical protein n=1 Tax=Rodentibacter caecimuris TaxID=1796644 RepID=UPI0008591893|nr:MULTISPECIES: hypothetical protein [Pasteurellaceae]AOF54252.1 hypothetical protein AC062_2165 [Pasteurellaceae bacterium NI1060]